MMNDKNNSGEEEHHMKKMTTIRTPFFNTYHQPFIDSQDADSSSSSSEDSPKASTPKAWVWNFPRWQFVTRHDSNIFVGSNWRP
jgi:hypothetical protein